MRRCPHCGSPNPDPSGRCQACHEPLPPLPRAPLLRLSDVWNPAGLKRALLAAAVLSAFQMTAGGLLTVGAERVEARFLTYHLLHGLLLGAGLAWVRGARGRRAAAWLLVGLAGGALAEGAEIWFTYRHMVADLSVLAWRWFGLAGGPELSYRMLQVLRLGAAALPLALFALGDEKRLIRGVFSITCLAAALLLRSLVRGAFVSWGAVLQPSLSGPMLGLFAASAFVLAYGLGQRALTPEALDR
jgi:hypothetical protein